nr:xylulokinase [Candidatus Bathyarchaeota archaeon]
MTLMLGIDVGTSSTKVIIINEEGKVLAGSSYSYTMETPKPGYAEQKPELWWKALVEALKEIPQDLIKSVEAIGFSGQMHGTVILDRKRKPVRPAILWADKRSVRQCSEIYQKVDMESIIERISNPIMPGFMGPTLLWLLENESDSIGKARWAVLPKDYVRLRLTGVVATDFSDASATLLFDVSRRKWAFDIISLLGIPVDLLPEVFDSSHVIGEVTSEAARETGLPRGVPVVTGGGDSQVGALGCGVVREGVVSSN